LALQNFKIKTTVEWDIEITVGGVAPTLTVLDVITIVLKNHIDDTDEEAVITQVGTNTAVDGTVHFEFTPTDTDIEARVYYYEYKWESNGKVTIPESGFVTVGKRVWD
jgi:hypothetical protein